MKAIMSGLIFGLTIAFSFGPGIWALFQTTINNGFKSGIFFLSGVFLSDFSFMLLALLSINTFAKELCNSIWLGIISSIVMIIFGVFSFLKKNATPIIDRNKDVPIHLENIGYILKGYFFNTSNPFNLLFWLGVVTISSGTYGINSFDSFLFIGSIFVTSLSFDILKCFFASRLQKIIKISFLGMINKIIGIVMITCGCFIFWKTCL